jgi:tRNA(Ser,Leu) C12 N-acetylase TAN1
MSVHDWNVVVSVHDGGYQHVRQALTELGTVGRTDFYNVLVLKVDDIPYTLEGLQERLQTDDRLKVALARLMPVSQAFTFQKPEEFESRAKGALLPLIPGLAGKGFHVRMHRRGFKGRLSSKQEERILAEFVFAGLENARTPGHIAFGDPDAVLAIETIGQRAGVALWSRDELKRYPFLHVNSDGNRSGK